MAVGMDGCRTDEGGLTREGTGTTYDSTCNYHDEQDRVNSKKHHDGESRHKHIVSLNQFQSYVHSKKACTEEPFP